MEDVDNTPITAATSSSPLAAAQEPVPLPPVEKKPEEPEKEKDEKKKKARPGERGVDPGIPLDANGVPRGATALINWEGGVLNMLPQYSNRASYLAASSFRVFSTLTDTDTKRVTRKSGSGNLLAVLPSTNDRVEIIIGTNEHVIPDTIDNFNLSKIEVTNQILAPHQPHTEYAQCIKLSSLKQSKKWAERKKEEGYRHYDIAFIQCNVAKRFIQSCRILTPAAPGKAGSEVMGVGYPGSATPEYRYDTTFFHAHQKLASMGRSLDSDKYFVYHASPTKRGISGTHFGNLTSPIDTYEFVHRGRRSEKNEGRNEGIKTTSVAYACNYATHVLPHTQKIQYKLIKDYFDQVKGAEEACPEALKFLSTAAFVEGIALAEKRAAARKAAQETRAAKIKKPEEAKPAATTPSPPATTPAATPAASSTPAATPSPTVASTMPSATSTAASPAPATAPSAGMFAAKPDQTSAAATPKPAASAPKTAAPKTSS